MIFATTPPDTPGQPGSPSAPGNTPQNDQGPLPFYRRPLFWLLIGLLVGVIALLLLHSCRTVEPAEPKAEPVPEATPQQPKEDADAALKELLELQQAHNRGLEEEVRRLQQLMQEDPCALPALIGPPPGQSPVAPGYAPHSPSGSQAQPKANGTLGQPPSANATSVPASNATVPATGGKATSVAPSALPAPETVGDLLDKATVFILSHYNGQTGMGSGFFVAPGVIATNSHVVQAPAAQVVVGNKALGGMREARVIAYSREENRDYALLRVSNELAAKAPVLLITDGAKRMEKVSAWGFPGYIAEIDPKLKALAQGDIQAVPEVVYSEGVVSVVLDRKPPAILHTASISQGNSGGPLVNSQGVVVGINTFIKQADRSYSQTNIALPGEDLAKFMREQGIQASLTSQ